MHIFTVVWKKDALDALARLWNENPRVRQDIANAADRMDRLLATDPLACGEPISSRGRQFVVLPLKALVTVAEQDRVARVLYVKYWYD